MAIPERSDALRRYTVLSETLSETAADSPTGGVFMRPEAERMDSTWCALERAVDPS
jgi:hypothetical protein